MRPSVHRESLRPHPSSPTAALRELYVDIDWRDRLTLHYALLGIVDALRVPAQARAERTDELWRHTCCELFLAVPGSVAYLEFNFSPGGPWAAYRFDGYRSGMQALEIATPTITTHLTPTQLDVRVALDLAAIPQLAGVQALHCALTAVIEEQSGTRSFWALAHPAAQPDFHHVDGFALRLVRSLAGS